MDQINIENEHDGEIQIDWLAWLSSKGEKERLKNKYCIFAGLSRNIPDDIKCRIGIKILHDKYCAIYEA